VGDGVRVLGEARGARTGRSVPSRALTEQGADGAGRTEPGSLGLGGDGRLWVPGWRHSGAG